MSEPKLTEAQQEELMDAVWVAVRSRHTNPGQTMGEYLDLIAPVVARMIAAAEQAARAEARGGPSVVRELDDAWCQVDEAKADLDAICERVEDVCKLMDAEQGLTAGSWTWAGRIRDAMKATP